MTAHIANHPYIACALFLAIGVLAGWLANMLTVERPQHTSDDDITGIGA
jgi:hypothetical protein